MTHATPTERDLERIRTKLLQMYVRAESMVRLAVRSVLQRDPALGRSVVEADEELDSLEMELDRLCLRCLALRQPVGADLRMVTTVMKMVTDLERIGDLAVNVANRGIELAQGGGVQPHADLERMGDIAADMLRQAADALLTEDSSVAVSLRSRDQEVDELNRNSFARWVAAVGAYPDQAERVLALTSISRYLERIADHAVNLGEMVVFAVEGEDVRHVG